MTSYQIIDSPLREILLRADDGALTGMFFSGQKYYPAGAPATYIASAADQRVLDQAAQELAAYFDGALQTFAVPIRFIGSAFQQRIWQALCDIEFGDTSTYGQLGAGLGLPPAHSRAVGGAVGRNPLSVIVPCHRVLGASGALTGYAGGVDRKRALLRLEGVRGVDRDVVAPRAQGLQSALAFG
ncbi:methylated-DNA-[protein]-cysteine S-methyltransferase [Cupriavidus sp. OV038]|uniref:methylated-DNA--[protein]-cysteine S-methyltransferase n=1 Tax=unclassified Cupriavidus TaxID=2640874 RepID=UPI0008F3AAD9|nr:MULTISPECIES: methylated-DNA--[protein]-cysteine S-methyltransferase [unclassified Cupriavidus]SFD43606.1 methylated-DNA-[protein]-cysteine S-methyltransferase [Cupriavidus sp. OV038]SFQ14174.1 methylated-DNA-[protein]-cysteine S-methyltransferase [Cupriavidus sp. OV096]